MAESKRKTRASETFSADEKAAMREAARERKRAATGKADGEADVRAKIAEMPAAERDIAERLHALVKKTAPGLEPRTWYGMPAYAKAGKVVCFFQPGTKFKSRYSTLGFSDQAHLDDGNMWPTSYALPKLTRADEKRVAALINQAVGE